MKFAKELENELVPEWRIKYLDYKLGKKKITAITKALRNVNNSSSGPRPNRATPRSYFTPTPLEPDNATATLARIQTNKSRSSPINTPAKTRNNTYGRPSPIPQQKGRNPEQQPLNDDFSARDGLARYGSIIGSPVSGSKWGQQRGPAPLELPDPALRPSADFKRKHSPLVSEDSGSPLVRGSNGNAYEAGETKHPPPGATLPRRHRSMFQPQRVSSMPGNPGSRPLMKRLMSLGGNVTPSPGDVPLEAYRDLDTRQTDFFNFLDGELDKIESFYKLKEDAASERLKVLREQLHIMRDSRVEELIHERAGGVHNQVTMNDGSYQSNGNGRGETTGKRWLHAIDNALESARHGGFGRRSKAMRSLASPHISCVMDENRDYVRRRTKGEIPYRTAKRKLKAAMQEFYRGLELLKSYALLNRKAFRKINKKYDKAVNARPPLRYMSDKVNDAWFVKSDVLDGHIRAVEDLYARYFEGGNYKVAASKLRAKTDRPNDFNGTVFRNGLMAATGLCFGIEGIVYASRLLYDHDPVLAQVTSYLLQIYGGYFLMLFLMLFFVVDCKIWTTHKVNYVFVFEFDTRHHLDWRQLAELPCFFMLLLGLFIWLNFTRYGAEEMYTYYPVGLVCITALVLFFPAPILFHRSRNWFLVSLGRLSLSPFFPVEFRDFFLGDMFCSLTYSMGNIALYFCLYRQGFSDPPKCNSSHLRLIGFFSALPGIWRALQCLRRYRDTRNAFPHLANCGKYTFTILYYMSLSIYRIDRTYQLRAFFIFCATVNATYCSVWDLVMDWSLVDPFAPKMFLRENLAFKNTWWYYAAMIIDPILRFNWIFYVIFPTYLQTSALLSFCVAFSEVCRRGVWTIFRVENEHCTNVGRFRASRDIPLPYDFKQPETVAEEGRLLSPTAEEEEEMDMEEQRRQGIQPSPMGKVPSSASGTDLHQTTTKQSATSSTLRRRKRLDASPLMKRMGSILHMAHAQDFERKRRPEAGEEADKDDDDDDDEVSDEVEEEEVEAAERVVDEESARVEGDEGEVGESGGEMHWRFGIEGGEHEDRGEMSSGPQSPGRQSPVEGKSL